MIHECKLKNYVFCHFPDQENTMKLDVNSDHDNSVDVIDNDDDLGYGPDGDLDNEHGDMNGRPRKIRR